MITVTVFVTATLLSLALSVHGAITGKTILSVQGLVSAFLSGVAIGTWIGVFGALR